MAPPKKKDKETEEAPQLTPEAILAAHQKAHKEDHLNDVAEIYFRTSTGSLMWDIETGGGLPPGLHRFIGPPESGKTSAALELCRNFLLPVKNRRGLYIKSEGRLSEEMKKRCGLKFIYKPEEWVDGTIYVVESNIYEYVINLLRALIKGGPTATLFCIIIDSTDGLILKDDAIKTFDQNNKVAGTPALTKKFMQSMANEMSKRGHTCVMMSQYTSNITLDAYAKAEDKKPTQGSGGWGAAHFANFAFEFLTPFAKDDITEKPNVKAGKDNKRVGKRANIRFKKSTNEKTGTELSYPIKFGVVGRSSIWREREVCDMMLAYGHLRPAGSWLKMSPRLSEELMSKKFPVTLEMQLQGEPKWHAWLESNSEIVEYLYAKFRDELSGQQQENTDVFQETEDASSD